MRIARRFLLLLMLSLVLISAQSGCSGRMRILYYNDTNWNYAGQALDLLGYDYDEAITAQQFYDTFRSKAWDLVIFDNSLTDSEINPYIEACLLNIAYFALSGAKVIITSPVLGKESADSFWELFGYEYAGLSYDEPWSVYRLIPEAELWNSPSIAPDLNPFYAEDSPAHEINAFRGNPVGTGQMIASFNAFVMEDMGAVFKANSNRTIVNAFYMDDFTKADYEPVDIDEDGIGDSIEWYMNEIAYLEKTNGLRVKPEVPSGGDPIPLSIW